MPVTRRQTQIKNDQQYRQGLYSELGPAINHGQNKHLGASGGFLISKLKDLIICLGYIFLPIENEYWQKILNSKSNSFVEAFSLPTHYQHRAYKF